MFANDYKNYYSANRQYAPYLDNDEFLSCLPASFKLDKIENKMIDFIEQEQLFDTKHWKLFTEQFKFGNVDDENLGWRGEYWGKMMRGACITYKYTQSSKLYEILENTVYDLLDTQDELGRFSTYSVGNEYKGWDLWSRKYILLGLLHFHEICKSEELKERIVTALKAHLDYIINGIGRGEGKIPVGETSNFWFGANSVSILEPVMRLYNLTGEKRYLDFAEYLVTDGPGGENNDIFELAYEGKLPPYKWNIRKAYELMSCFEGALEYYRVTGNEKYKISAINFAKLVMDTDVTIIGCCGCEHELFDNSAATQTDGTNTIIMQETCVTVTWIKLCYQLLRLTGDSVYADQIEKSVYNALYGAVNTERSKNNCGLPFDSYSPLILNKRGRAVGGRQDLPDGTVLYGCCAAIGAAGIGIVPELCMQQTKNGVAVTLYADGEYNLKTPLNSNIKLRVETNYPADGEVNITLESTMEEEFEIRLRVPKFSKNTVVTVCGEHISAPAGEYLSVKRRWTSGDVIKLIIDMSPRVIHPIGCEKDENSKNYIAVKYGPLVLARDLRLCPDAGEKVSLAFDANDRIELESSKTAKFDTLCEFEVPLTDGSFTKMIDYQSAGKTWDENSLVEAWLRN